MALEVQEDKIICECGKEEQDCNTDKDTLYECIRCAKECCGGCVD